jgi:hypothetical protein
LVQFDDGGRLRPVMYEGSLSELYVPYMDPGSSRNRVGEMGCGASQKAVYSIGIMHFSRTWNLPCDLDGTAISATTAAMGCVLLRWLAPRTDGARHFR